jgi:hypothetical protein
MSGGVVEWLSWAGASANRQIDGDGGELGDEVAG